MMTIRGWLILVALVLFGGCAVPVAAQQPALLAGAEAVIQRADTLAANHDYDGAVLLLKRAIEEYPTYERLYLDLAVCQEDRGYLTHDHFPTVDEWRNELYDHPGQYSGIVRDLFDIYGQAYMNLPDTREIHKRAEALAANDFPVELGEYGVLALPGDPTPFSFMLTDPQLDDAQRTACQALITLRPLPTPERYRKDPKYGSDAKWNTDAKYGRWSFSWMLAGYEFDRESKSWYLRFRVFWEDVPGHRDDRTLLAQQTVQLLLRTNGLLHAYTGLKPLFPKDGVINVWLAERGDPGGEASDENIYLQQIGVARSPAEWVREITHEYGHETLPPVGGYDKPEWAANGRLGERLFVSWFMRNLDQKTDPHPWLRDMNLADYQEARIERTIRQFAAMGPEMPQLSGKNAMAMDGCIGMALYWDLSRGSKALTAVLSSMHSPSFAGKFGFKEVLEENERTAQSVDHPTVAVRMDGLPPGIPLWVYLREGAWDGAFTSKAEGPLRLKVEVDGKPVKFTEAGVFSVTGLGRGWHRIRLTPDGDAVPALTGLKLVRIK